MLAESRNILTWVEHFSRKSCPCWKVPKVERAPMVEGVMDCAEAVEMIGRARLGIMMLYMENSGERKSLL